MRCAVRRRRSERATRNVLLEGGALRYGRGDLYEAARRGDAPMAVELDVLQRQLQDFSVTHYGKDAVVSNVEVMPGHAGLSFGFRVGYQEAGHAKNESLVMRMPP